MPALVQSSMWSTINICCVPLTIYTIYICCGPSFILVVHLLHLWSTIYICGPPFTFVVCHLYLWSTCYICGLPFTFMVQRICIYTYMHWQCSGFACNMHADMQSCRPAYLNWQSSRYGIWMCTFIHVQLQSISSTYLCISAEHPGN